MAVKFGVPPEGERIRSMVEERLRQAMAENGAKVTVEWRGEQKHLSVISMPVDLLYLNPDTHRIRAQRTLDGDRARAVLGHQGARRRQPGTRRGGVDPGPERRRDARAAIVVHET